MKAIWQSHVSGSEDDPFFLSSYDYSDFGDSIFPKGGVSKDEYIAAVTEVLGKDYSKQYQDLQSLKNVQGYIDTIIAALPWANNHPDVVIFLADLHNNFGGAFLTQDTGKAYTTWANHIWTAAYAAKGDSITIEDVLAAVNASDKSVLNGCTYKDAWIERRVSVCNDIIALKASMGDDFPTDCSSTSGANALLDFAYSWLNTPYSWGGGTNGPSKCNGDYGTCGVAHTATLGFDCSHFVYYCLTQCGYSKYGGYKATSAMHSTDWAGQGCQIVCTKENFDVGLLQPGDVILYSSHTTLYWGDGQEIGANGTPPHNNSISIRDIPKAPDMVIRVPQD